MAMYRFDTSGPNWGLPKAQILGSKHEEKIPVTDEEIKAAAKARRLRIEQAAAKLSAKEPFHSPRVIAANRRRTEVERYIQKVCPEFKPIDAYFAPRCMWPKSQPVFHIMQTVSFHFGITIEEIKSHRRLGKYVIPRQLAMYIAKDLTDMSLPELGKRFGNRDHTTVLHALRRTAERIAEDSEMANLMRELKLKIAENAVYG